MRYRITIEGLSPIIQHNGAAGLDKRSAANQEKAEIARKKGSNRTEADDRRLRELECQTSLWLDRSGTPTIPEAAIRAAIENGAKKLKQGPQVREGLIVDKVEKFTHDKGMGQPLEEIAKAAEFTVPVVVQRQRIERTRAKFDDWSCVFTIEADDELVDQAQLAPWLDIAGRRIGLGDWRPQKSGHYGRFEVKEMEAIG